MDWWPYIVGSVLVPVLVQMLRSWKVADTYKTAAALGVSVLVTVAGMLLAGEIDSWTSFMQSLAVVFAGSTVFYRTVLKPALEKGMAKILAPPIVLLVAFCLMGCPSVPTVPMPGGAGTASKGGDSDATKQDLTVPFAPAVAQPGGTANARAVSAKVERANTNSAAGESLVGVSFSGGEAFAERLKADPVILSLSQRIVDATKANPPDKALLAELYDAYREQSSRIAENVKRTSPNFGSLKVINVMALICKDNGAAEGETGDAQSRVVADAMAKVVAATMGVVEEDEPPPKEPVVPPADGG